MKKNYFIYCILLMSVALFCACQERSPEEEALEAFEKFVVENQKGNGAEAVRTICRGQMKENMQYLFAVADANGEKFNLFENYKGVLKAECVPDFSDVVLVVADFNTLQGQTTFVFHLDESDKWKLYYMEAGDLTPVKNFITSDSLLEIGILTLSDSEWDDLME